MTGCPTSAQLKRFLADESSDVDREAVGRHVSECPTCLEALERLSPSGSGLKELFANQARPRTGAEQAFLSLLAERPPHGAGDTRQSGVTGSSDPQRPPPTEPAFAPGERISHYRIVEKLGGGGMGVVYRAEDTRLGRGVALKFLPPASADDPQALERFRREARAASALNHPHICTLYDFDEHEGQPFLVLELMEGHTLKYRVSSQALPIDEMLDLAVQIADALDVAHTNGIVHRDIKPANLFVTSRSQAKVLDFGLAKLVGQQPPGTTEENLSTPGVVMGTVTYMSPEQARGQDLDGRTDLFSLGVVFYEMATGRHPFPGETVALLFDAILHRTPEPPSRLNPNVPPELDRIIAKALAKDRKERYQTAAELHADLKKLKRETDTGIAWAMAASRPVLRRFHWTVISAAALGLAVAVAVILYWIWPRPDPFGEKKITHFLTGTIMKQPAWSPTNDLVAFVSDDAGNDDIYVVDTDRTGDKPKPLTTYKGADCYPAWSPDGQRLAFFSERDNGGIFVMGKLGSDEPDKIVSVKSGILYTFSLAWADNTHLVYTNFDAEGEKQVYRISIKDPIPECLTAKVGPGQAGEISPSRSLFAFLSPHVGFAAKLYVCDLHSGKPPHEVAQLVGSPHWGPNSDSIFFISPLDGNYDLWKVDVNPKTGEKIGKPRKLTEAQGLRDFTVGPDGRKFIAVKPRSITGLWTFPANPDAVIKDTSGGKCLTDRGFDEHEPGWPCWTDDQTLLFSSLRGTHRDIWRMRVGGNPRQLTEEDGLASVPRASGDGRWISFDVEGEKRNDVYIMSKDGGKPHPLSPVLPQEYRSAGGASWGPDGSLACSFLPKQGKRQLGIVTMNRDTGTARQIKLLNLPGSAMPSYPAWSPNGKYIAYEAVCEGSWDLWVTDVECKEAPRRLTSDPTNERMPAFSRDGFLYYKKDRGIWRMPIDSEVRAVGPAHAWAEFERISGSSIYTHNSPVAFQGDRVTATLIKEEVGDLMKLEFSSR